MESIFFDIKVNIDNLDDFFTNSTNCEEVHTIELTIDGDKSNEIELKLFFKHQEHLGDKLIRWNHNNEQNLLERFEVLRIIQPENLLDVSFSSYRYNGMESSTAFYRDDYVYIKIFIRGIKLTYSDSNRGRSEFYLNEQAFELIEEHYYYKFPWENDYSWKPQNRVTESTAFNKIRYTPEYFFYNSSNEKTKVSITKEPRFVVEYDNLAESCIQSHIELLCSLYSFFCNQEIDYSFARIYSDNKRVEIIRDVNNSVDSPYGLFTFDFHKKPLNLMLNVDSSKLMTNLSFVKKIIERFNYSLKTTGESKFMILYSVLEQLRNVYLSESGISNYVKEEFDFTTSKRKTDNFIKEKLTEITDMVSEPDKKLFKEEIRFKIKPIKVVSMASQFQSFFEHTGIDPSEYELDFQELQRLRNSIFHGRSIDDDQNKLEHFNYYKRLPRFVGIVMLKYFGIDDLKNLTYKVSY